jgi:hypothetical protein
MAPREAFNDPVQGLHCPLCLSRNYTLVAGRDTERGILQKVYLCGDCRSYFGDVRAFDGVENGEKGPAGN